MSGWRIALGCVAVALSLHAHAAPVRDSDETVLATKAAMDAFFSLEGAVPNGVSKESPAVGFNPDTGQLGLIQFLGRQRARGARWDRYRYLGTLLHHSLRADFDDVTQWLLDHGADPTQRIEDNAEGQMDALGVAVRMERWPRVTKMLRHPAYQRMGPADVAARLWAGASTQAQREGLLRLRPAVPVPAVSTPAGSALLMEAMCGVDRTVVARLTAGSEAPVKLPTQQGCSQLEAPTPQRLDQKAWLALEPRFAQPVLPYLVAVARNSADLRSALSGGFQQPWGADKFVEAFVARVPKNLLPELLLSNSAWGAPTDRLWTQVSLHQAVELWKQPRARWEALVQTAPPVALNQLMNAGVWASFGREFPDRWEPLVARLDALPAYQRPVTKYIEALLGEATPSQFSRVLAWLVAADRVPEALPNWIFRTSEKGLASSWPVLKQQAPAWADQLLSALLAPLLAEPPTDRLGKGMLAYSVSHDGLAKARFLRSQGLKGTPRLLASSYGAKALEEVGAPGCCGADLASWALRERLVLLPKGLPTVVANEATASPSKTLAAKPVERLALVATPPDCRPDVSPDLRKALADWTLAEAAGSHANNGDDPGWIQPLAAPGQSRCQWLQSWVEITGGGWTDRSFFDGEEFQNHKGSIEQTLHLQRWDNKLGRFTELGGLSFATLLVEVELLPGGDRFWLALESDANGRRPANALSLTWKGAEPAWVGLAQTSSLDARWQAVVDPNEAGRSLGIAVTAMETPLPPRAALPREPREMSVFVDAKWAAEKAAFLADFADFQREALGSHRQAGLFAHWLDAAVLALSADAQMPIDQRRARMAWLLATPALANALGAEALQSLAPWLPAEDWRPITESRRCSSQYPPRLSGGDKAPPTLARRIAIELARDCNGSVK